MTDQPDQTAPPLRGAPRLRTLDLPAGVALVDELGSGSWGRVCRVRDVGDVVRVLKLYGERGHAIHELRMLTVARGEGAVRALGHDLDAPTPWIELELLDGPVFAADARERASALARSLARLHARGLVHRDVKPSNAMMRGEEPVLLDLGIATWIGAIPDPTLGPGTPLYAAPEQVAGGPADPASDVYALGLTLCEAFLGRLPSSSERSGTDLATLSPPLRALLLDMLHPEPGARPTAQEVAARLRGEPWPDQDPYWGDRAWLEELEPAPGAILDVGGPPGSGRSRALRERAASRPAHWIFRGDRPYSSLMTLLGEVDAPDEGGVRSALRTRCNDLERPIFADDWDHVDPESRALLEEHPPRAGLVRVVGGPATVEPPLLPTAALVPLFEGPERVLHLPSDAADELSRRSGGNPGRVRAVLRAWEQQGFIQRRDRYQITPDALQQLRADQDEPALEQPARLSEAEDEVLTAIRLAGDNARPPTLAAILDLPGWEVEALLRRLRSGGWVGLQGDRLLARAKPRAAWSPERSREAHRRLALVLGPEALGGTAARIAAGLHAGLPEIALREAERLQRENEPRRARELLRSALAELPRHEGLRGRVVHALLEDRSSVQNDEVREIASPSSPLRALAEAVLAARHGDAAGALTALAAMSFQDPVLEMLRHASRVDATRRARPEAEEALLDELAGLPLIQEDPEHLARWRTWRAGLHYRERRFDQAGALHEQAAQRAHLVGRLSSLRAAASAYTDAGDFSNARRNAEAALQLARDARSSRFEAEAEWVLRALANRGGSEEPDADLVECARLLGNSFVLGAIALTEAFIGHRGRDPRALDWARTAERAFAASRTDAAIAHAAALAISLGDRRDPAPIRAALWRLRAEHPVSTLDGLRLLGPPVPGEPAEWRALLAEIPAACREHAIGRYSPAETVQWMEALSGPGG